MVCSDVVVQEELISLSHTQKYLHVTHSFKKLLSKEGGGERERTILFKRKEFMMLKWVGGQEGVGD